MGRLPGGFLWTGMAGSRVPTTGNRRKYTRGLESEMDGGSI